MPRTVTVAIVLALVMTTGGLVIYKAASAQRQGVRFFFEDRERAGRGSSSATSTAVQVTRSPPVSPACSLPPTSRCAKIVAS
jgi:hypothetical protein